MWQAIKEKVGAERPPVKEMELRLPFKEPVDEKPQAYDNIFADGYRDYKGTVKANHKRRYSSKRIAKRRLVVVHQTGTRFGTSSRARNRWAKLRAESEGRSEISEEDRKYAETMALFERFWKVPYHEVSLISGYVLDNSDVHDWTHHGGYLNFALSWSLEGKYPSRRSKRQSKHTELTNDIIETGRAGLERLIHRSREAGAPADQIVPHRTGSSNRLADCGEEVWQEIVVPVGKKMDCEFLYSFKRSTGRPIPNDWDESALYDWRGNRL